MRKNRTIGLTLSINNFVSHRITVDFEDGRQEVFDAHFDLGKECQRFYKVDDGEIQDDTYLQLEHGDVVLVIDDEEMQLDVIDGSSENASLRLSCENDSCESVEIYAECILDQEDAKNDIISISSFDDNDDEWEDDDDEWDDDDDEWDDDDEYEDDDEDDEDELNEYLDDVDEAVDVLEQHAGVVIATVFEQLDLNETEITEDIYAVYLNHTGYHCVKLEKIYLKFRKHNAEIYCSALDEQTGETFNDAFQDFLIPADHLRELLHEIVSLTD